MKKKKLKVQGITINIDTEEYVSLTDIAKSSVGKKPADLISNWMQNQKTLVFLETWETVHNPDFKVVQMHDFRIKAVSERYIMSPKKYIEATNAIGMISNAGRYGGTFAHLEIALAFAYWLEPSFQVYFLKEFNRMKVAEAKLLDNTRNWVFEKVLRSAEELKVIAELGQNLQEEE